MSSIPDGQILSRVVNPFSSQVFFAGPIKGSFGITSVHFLRYSLYHDDGLVPIVAGEKKKIYVDTDDYRLHIPVVGLPDEEYKAVTLLYNRVSKIVHTRHSSPIGFMCLKDEAILAPDGCDQFSMDALRYQICLKWHIFV